MTKKERCLSLFDEGVQDIETIAELVGANPTYVATSLMDEGRSIGYSDLYTPSRPRNRYSEEFAGVLRFKNEESAQESVRQIGMRYERYRLQGDRQGQYQARSLALIGYERAMGLGKVREAQVFAEWLQRSLHEEIQNRFSADYAGVLPYDAE